MKTLIIIALFVCAGCTNRAQDAQNARDDQKPNLHTIGYIGDIKVQVGYAEINLD